MFRAPVRGAMRGNGRVRTGGGMRTDEVETAIVGAGAAGLAAARRLRALGVRCLVLEAKDRAGGRACTDRAALGLPFDLGCHWLHSADRNPLAPAAARFGFALVRPRSPRRIHGRGGWTDAAGRAEWAAFERRQSRLVEAAGAAGRDVPASAALEHGHRWSQLYEAWFGILNGAPPGAVSTADLARYRDSGDNRQVRDGLGALVARLAAGVPVRLRAPVRSVGWGRGGVEVEGAAGRVRARTAIVTVSTTVLARGRIRFDPPLPDAKREAFEGLRLGHALRIAVRLAPGALERPWGDAGEDAWGFFGGGGADALAFQVRPCGHAIATAYAGAGTALDLERAGLAEARALVLERLAAAFGADAVRRAGAAVMSGWAEDADVGGAYSFARPGGGGLRAALAAPLAGRLWFAGEAASRHGYSTVHGAWESGRRAADAAAAALGRLAPARGGGSGG